MFLSSAQSVFSLSTGLPACSIALLSLSVVLSLPAMANSDGAAQLTSVQRRLELRSTVRLPVAAAAAPVATAPAAAAPERHLSPQERADLRKQLSRELRAQAGAATVR